MDQFNLLKHLLYMDLGEPAFDFSTENCFVMKSGAALSFCNRAYAAKLPTVSEINSVQSFLGEMPFRWFVNKFDTDQINLLESIGFKYHISFPAMNIDLDNLQNLDYKSEITIQKIDFDLLPIWLNIATRSFDIKNDMEYQKFIEYIICRSTKQILYFYIGFFKGEPATCSFALQKESLLHLHYIGVVPEFRGKGLGFAITHKALLDAKEKGCVQSILLASQMGKPVYDKIGFKEYAVYNTYGLV